MDLDQRSVLDDVGGAFWDYLDRVWAGYIFPALAFIIAFVGGVILRPCANWLERRGIDDAVGAVTVHCTIGVYGVIMLGVFTFEFPELSARQARRR